MCWKQEYIYTGCGCRVIADSVVVKSCASAEAYGRPCLGSFENPARNIVVRRAVCAPCARAGAKRMRR
ncbi:hypothetical protein F4861DRAFT_511459 [Xylaria intraflava]|nr:hypothetical protein F4861DRAFT_511459 [Xylaria intraflava]